MFVTKDIVDISQPVTLSIVSPQTPKNESETDFGDMFERIFLAALHVDKFYTPFLCLAGILGNSLSILVFCINSKYRRQTSSYYLSALAVSDAGFLINLFAVWLEGVYGGIITSSFACPLVMYLGQVTCFVSVYLTVGFTLERYIAVDFPLSRPRLCTLSNAKRYICGVVVVALVIFSNAWQIAEVVEVPTSEQQPGNSTTELSEKLNNQQVSVCTVPEKYLKVSEIANYIDSAVTLIIPVIIITYCNICIVLSVKKTLGRTDGLISAGENDGNGKTANNINKFSALPSQRELLESPKSKHLGRSRVASGRGNRRLAVIFKSKKKPPSSDMRVTKMLVLVSTVFLVLNLPLHVLRCAQFFQIAAGKVVEGDQPTFLEALQPWANLIFNTNFAVNFLLYCATGARFRRSLSEILVRFGSYLNFTRESNSRTNRFEMLVRRF